MTIIENIKLARMKALGRGGSEAGDRGMELLKRVAHRVVFMDEGRIEEDRVKDNFFGSPRGDRAEEFLSKNLTH